MFGLDYMIFRPHNVYGELQNIGDRYRNVLGIFMNQIMRGRAAVDLRRRHADPRLQLRRRRRAGRSPAAPTSDGARGEIFNVGADQPWSVNELAA